MSSDPLKTILEEELIFRLHTKNHCCGELLLFCLPNERSKHSDTGAATNEEEMFSMQGESIPIGSSDADLIPFLKLGQCLGRVSNVTKRDSYHVLRYL